MNPKIRHVIGEVSHNILVKASRIQYPEPDQNTRIDLKFFTESGLITIEGEIAIKKLVEICNGILEDKN